MIPPNRWLPFIGIASLLATHASASGFSLRSSKDEQIPPIYPIGFTEEPFAKVAGRLFDLNGTVGHFAGCNAWWLGHLMNNTDVDIAMQQMAETGYKIIRVWGFSDTLEENIPPTNATDPNRVWYQMINETGGYINYGPDGMQRMDYAVSAAEKYGLKLVLPFVNHWAEYGGLPVYEAAFGGYDKGWFDNEMAQEVYRDWVKLLVTRYINSTAIFAWQLGNEPRCMSCDSSVITEWASDVSAWIKELDPNHMVTLGDEGWFGKPTLDTHWTLDSDYGDIAYGEYHGIDFEKNLQIPTLDYGTFHLYPSLWGYSFEWGNMWIEQHDDAGREAWKPVVLEEYGSPDYHDHAEKQAPWQATIRKTGVAADQIWQFGPSGISFDPLTFGDENSVYYDEEEFKILGTGHAQAMLAKEVPPDQRRERSLDDDWGGGRWLFKNQA